MNDTPDSRKWQDEQALIRFQVIAPLLDAELDPKKKNALRQQIACATTRSRRQERQIEFGTGDS